MSYNTAEWISCAAGDEGGPEGVASLVTQMVKHPPADSGDVRDAVVGKIPWEREWLPTPVFLTGEPPGLSEEPGGLQSMGLQRVRHK